MTFITEEGGLKVDEFTKSRRRAGQRRTSRPGRRSIERIAAVEVSSRTPGTSPAPPLPRHTPIRPHLPRGTQQLRSRARRARRWAAVDSRTYAIDRAIEPLRWVFRWAASHAGRDGRRCLRAGGSAREIFATPIIGASELARFMLICSVFLALPYVVSSGANIRMEEILSTMLPAGVVRTVIRC